MTKVLVIHYTEDGQLPKLSEDELKSIQEDVKDRLEKEEKVEFNGTFVNEEGMGICDWEAPNANTVKEIVDEVIGAPYDEVIEVEQALPV